MNMKKSFLSEFSQQLTGLYPYIGTEEFTVQLVNMFKSLVPTDAVMVLLFPSKKLPVIEYNAIPSEQATPMVDQYIKGAFLLDPFYLAARKNNKSVFSHLKDVAPDAFEESEYYKTYYKYSGLTDECAYLIRFDDEGANFVIIGLGQIKNDSGFSAKDIENLADILPLVELFTQKHWKTINNESELEQNLDIRQQLETGLDCFGTSILTDRENQTVKMILQGYSSKAIAGRFKISVETVKLHRKNAYAKLDLGTQGELFNLFINSLMNIENYSGGDPLIAYHSTKVK